MLEAIGMAWLAEDMHGLPQVERTRRIELIRSLLVYNICGDRLFLPFEGGNKRATTGQATGVRAGHFEGLAAANLLAFLANADARRWFRDHHEKEYAVLSERMFNQRDIENYFAELASLAGYKPSQRMLEARARKVDFNHQWRDDASLGRCSRVQMARWLSCPGSVDQHTCDLVPRLETAPPFCAQAPESARAVSGATRRPRRSWRVACVVPTGTRTRHST